MAIPFPAREAAQRDGVRQSRPKLPSSAVLASRRRRTRFIFAAAAFLLAFNILQPVLSVFTRLLDPPILGPLTWGWLFGFAQFVVPLVVLHLYVARSDAHDRVVARDGTHTVRQEA